MALIKNLAEMADLLGIANLFLNTKQVKQQKMLRLILLQQEEILKKLKEKSERNENY